MHLFCKMVEGYFFLLNPLLTFFLTFIFWKAATTVLVLLFCVRGMAFTVGGAEMYLEIIIKS